MDESRKEKTQGLTQGLRLIYQNIAAATKEISAIAKNKENKQQGFKFRGIDDAYNALQPVLSRNDLFTIPEVISDRTEERQSRSGGALIYRIFTIKYTVYTTDGSSVSGVVIGEGMDSGDKAGNKAMAIGHKYFLLQLFCVPTEDMKDPEAESHDVASTAFITDDQVFQIVKVMQEKAVDKVKFFKWAGVNTVEEIKAGDFNKVMDALRKAKGSDPNKVQMDAIIKKGAEKDLDEAATLDLLNWALDGKGLTKALAAEFLTNFETHLNRYLDKLEAEMGQ